MKKIRTQISVNPDQYEATKQYAKYHHISIASVVRMALQEYLEKYNGKKAKALGRPVSKNR